MKIKYLFAALLTLSLVACGGEKQPTGDDSGLVIASSKRYVAADGTDAVKFTVTNGGIDVTSSAAIYSYIDKKSTPLEGNAFTSTKIGNYKFYAAYNGLISAKIPVDAVTRINTVPADPDATNLLFKRRVLAMQGTSTGCTFCPLMIQTVHDFLGTANADNAVFTSAHMNMNGQDMMTSYGSIAIINYLGITSIPVLYFDFVTQNALGSNASVKMFNAAINARLAESASCGLAATVENVDGRICVDAEIKAAVAGKYTVCAYLLEDGIYAVQSDGTGIITDSNREEMYTHNNVVRAISGENPMGEELGYGALKEGDKVVYHCEFDDEDAFGEKINIANCHVAVYVVGSDKTVANVINCPMNSSVAYAYQTK